MDGKLKINANLGSFKVLGGKRENKSVKLLGFLAYFLCGHLSVLICILIAAVARGRSTQGRLQINHQPLNCSLHCLMGTTGK